MRLLIVQVSATSGEDDGAPQEWDMYTVLPGSVDLVATLIQLYQSAGIEGAAWLSKMLSSVLDNVRQMTDIEDQASCLGRGLADPVSQVYREQIGCALASALAHLPASDRISCERVLISRLHPSVQMALFHRMNERANQKELEDKIVGEVPDERLTQVCQEVRDRCLDRAVTVKVMKKLDDDHELSMDSDDSDGF